MHVNNMDVNRIANSSQYFPLLPQDVNNVIFNDLLLIDPAVCSTLARTCKDNYSAIKGDDHKIWELSTIVSASFRKNYGNGILHLRKNPYPLSYLFDVLPFVVSIPPIVGLKPLIPIATTYTLTAIPYQILKKLYLDGKISYNTHSHLETAIFISPIAIYALTSAIVDVKTCGTIGATLLGGGLVTLMTLDTLKETDLSYKVMALATTFGVALLPSVSLAGKAFLVAPILISTYLVQESLNPISSTVVKKAYGVACGSFGAAKEALSWGWNLGIPKLRRSVFG